MGIESKVVANGLPVQPYGLLKQFVGLGRRNRIYAGFFNDLGRYGIAPTSIFLRH